MCGDWFGCPCLAQGHLPLAKLCALVTMGRVGDPGRGQPFAIPLTPTSREGRGEEGGVLHVRVVYSHKAGGEERAAKDTSSSSSLITLSVGILRACGLREAAETCAAEREPLVMGQPARDGVNAFVKLRLPQGIVKVCHTICIKRGWSEPISPLLLSSSPQDVFETKAVARSFCPEFSHHFAVALPLGGGGGARVALAEVLRQGRAEFEVWHKVDQVAPQVGVT